MCLVIYPSKDDAKIQLEFVLECLYQRRDGGTSASVDMLIHNCNNEATVGRLRLLLPFCLSQVGQIRKAKNWFEADSKVTDFRRAETNRVKLKTTRLLNRSDPTNWKYDVLDHVNFDLGQIEEGRFGVKRRNKGDNLSGVIKQNWEVVPSGDDISNQTWLLMNMFQTTVFDVKAPADRGEELQVGESMWLRIFVDAPPFGINKMNIWQKILSRSFTYCQTFKTPKLVCEGIRSRVNSIYSHGLGFEREVIGQMMAAAGNVENICLLAKICG